MVLISTMKWGTTLTTSIQVSSSRDLSDYNEVVHLPCTELPSGITLSGISWLAEKSALPDHDEVFRILKFVYALIVRKLGEYSVWVIAGCSVWQPDTRIVRYRKLWGAMKARGIDTQQLISPAERMLQQDGKLKFFGAAQLSESSLKTAVDILLEERCAYLAVLPIHFDIQELLQIGWTGDLLEDYELAIRLSKAGGALIKRVGEFDDRERGFVLVGLPEFVNGFVK